MARTMQPPSRDVPAVFPPLAEKSEERSGTRWARIPAERLAAACGALVGNGWEFDSAFAYREGPSAKAQPAVAYLFRAPQSRGRIVLYSIGNRFPSVSSTLRVASWDERKMAETHGITFDGLSDSRPLLSHPENWAAGSFASAVEENRKQTPSLPGEPKGEYPMNGTGAPGEFEVPVGPVHAGIIEPGHFRFHVVGEEIQRMEVRLGYMHRGIERAAEGKAIHGLVSLAEQVSGDESVANAVACAQAAESLLELEVPERALAVRVILLELERVYSHLADVGGIAVDVGFYAAAMPFMALREDCMRINSSLAGNRFLRGVCSIGGVTHDLSASELGRLPAALASISRDVRATENLALASSTFLDRAYSTGYVSKADALRLGLVGPAARASGVPCDLRVHAPYGAYASLGVNESLTQEGDVLSRFHVKVHEIQESLRVISELSSHMPKGGLLGKDAGPAQDGAISISGVEAPRGACAVLLQAGKGNTVRRFAVRTASFRNWPALETAVNGNIIADFPVINKSFNLSYAGADV